MLTKYRAIRLTNVTLKWRRWSELVYKLICKSEFINLKKKKKKRCSPIRTIWKLRDFFSKLHLQYEITDVFSQIVSRKNFVKATFLDKKLLMLIWRNIFLVRRGIFFIFPRYTAEIQKFILTEDNISSNQVFSNFFIVTFISRNFCPKKSESKSLWFLRHSVEKWKIYCHWKKNFVKSTL